MSTSSMSSRLFRTSKHGQYSVVLETLQASTVIVCLLLLITVAHIYAASCFLPRFSVGDAPHAAGALRHDEFRKIDISYKVL